MGSNPDRLTKEKLRKMKKFALLLSLVFLAAGVANAAGAKKTASHKAHAKAAAKAEAGKTHAVEAEVVSTDVDKKTITIKGDKENKTVPVDEKAVASLKDLKPGDKVTLTCWDNAAGEHIKVVAVATGKPMAKPAKKG
jgi:Cu/Ag efflux protein CusF